MTETQILTWIKNNFAPYIQKALAARPGTIYTEDWLAGMTCRETDGLLARYILQKVDVLVVCSLLRGDYTQRPGESAPQYHGYGPTQFDIGSFPDFIHAGYWKDPLKCYIQTIDVLEGKRKYILARFPEVAGDSLNHYITASWNCGQGNEAKVLQANLDPDAYTAGHNYSNQVFEYADIYKTL